MKAWVVVGKSGRLKLVAEGKAKMTNIEEIRQWGSSDSLLKGKETGSHEVRKTGAKETNRGEDPLTNHWTKAIAETIGL